jgi:hypothetical protein
MLGRSAGRGRAFFLLQRKGNTEAFLPARRVAHDFMRKIRGRRINDALRSWGGVIMFIAVGQKPQPPGVAQRHIVQALLHPKRERSAL